MAGILIVEFKERDLIVDHTGFSIPADEGDGVAIEPRIIFMDPDAPRGRIDNTGHPFPTGMTDFAADQTPKPQA